MCWCNSVMAFSVEKQLNGLVIPLHTSQSDNPTVPCSSSWELQAACFQMPQMTDYIWLLFPLLQLSPLHLKNKNSTVT